MKYLSAILLGFLLLLPLGLIAAANSSLPTPGTPTLYVTPPIALGGPCQLGTTFTINVNMWNQKATGYDIYGFDFTLDWSSIPDIELVSAMYTSPWANYFPVANTTSGTPPTDYHLALTATPPSTGITDINASVLTLTFQVTQDLCWPDQITGQFTLTGNMVGDGNVSQVIPGAEFDNGTYTQVSYQPNMDLTSTAATAGVITEKCVSQTFDVEVDLTNVTNVYGFGFSLNFNPCYLETDPQKITPKPTFAGPYEYTAVYVGTAAGVSTPFGVIYAGELVAAFVRPSEKPGICGADVPAVDIIFHTIWTANTTNTQLPTPFNSTISIGLAFVMVKCNLASNPEGWVWPGPGEYNNWPGTTPSLIANSWGASIGYIPSWVLDSAGLTYDSSFSAHAGLGLIVGPGLQYNFKPSIYDLNLDCVVDIQDLKVLLPYYGLITSPSGNSYGDLSNLVPPELADQVTIFDFVQVAKHFGPVDP
jgi:hypothetical protein